MMRAAIVLLVAAACDGGAPTTHVERVTPAFGPLAGGTVVTIEGELATPARVLIGGVESPLVRIVDERSLAVVVPPGELPGDAEVLVIDPRGTASATGVFRYSAPPAIAAVSPSEVVYSTPATMTLTGSGFAEEDAGEPIVLVDGIAASDVEVIDDTTLTFRAPPGRPLALPEVQIANARGLASYARAFRYRPSAHGGLLLFTPTTPNFAVFYDPVDNTTVPIPRLGTLTMLTTVSEDAYGDYWAVDRNSRIGRIDLATQRFEQVAPMASRVPATARVGSVMYAIDRQSGRFGTIGGDGAFTAIGDAPLPCCGGYGLAFDGVTLWFASRLGVTKTIAAVDRTTGTLGTPITLSGHPGMHIEELRFFGGALYATSRDGTLLRIDPTSGVTTIVLTSLSRANAMEVFE